MYKELFLLLELGSLNFLFICGLIFIIIRQQYVFAVGITVAVVLLFAVCYINEKILDKLDEIKETVYQTNVIDFNEL